MTKRVLVTGASGQDGTYLSEVLLARGCEVYGVVGPFPGDFHERAATISGLCAVEADMTDMDSLRAAVQLAMPDEVYNFAALSSVGESWNAAIAVAEVNAVGVVRMLEALRELAPRARFFQASSAEMFGGTAKQPQSEATALRPESPYATSKAYAHTVVGYYREAHGMYACSGILYNHESPLRGPGFVTGKIARAVARIRIGLDRELRLGNLDSRRDWGFAGDYVEAMWLMLQQDEPGDFVISSGETHSVREFCQAAFEHVGLDWERHVVVDPALLRLADVGVLCGDSSKARRLLGWVPRVGFTELVAMMVDASLESEMKANAGAAR